MVRQGLVWKTNLIPELTPAAFVFRACQEVTKSHSNCCPRVAARTSTKRQLSSPTTFTKGSLLHGSPLHEGLFPNPQYFTTPL